MVVGWQIGLWSADRDVAVGLCFDWSGNSSWWSFNWSSSNGRWRWLSDRELLLHLDVRIDCVHAEVEVRAVLLVILWANVGTSLLSWRENIGASAALNEKTGWTRIRQIHTQIE
jgi:hypothetical protein